MNIIAESMKTVKYLFKGILEKLVGGNKRRAAAEIAIEYGVGGQSFVAKELQISRNTVRKGINEIKTGEIIEDRFSERGRKKVTEKLPEIEKDISEIMEGQSQADPKFQTTRLYTNMSIKELKKQLIKRNKYTCEELPSERTLNTITNDMKYTVRTVKKTKPKEKIPETDFIFENLDRLHKEAAEDDEIVRLSVDTKDRVKIGKFSRGGTSRVGVEAYDHDFGDEYVTPFGIMDVKEKTVDVSLSTTKVTADFMVDRLEEYWLRKGYSGKTLLLNADNGPENNSSRTQFVKRMIQFSIDNNTPVILAYYPPYHSKYNPIERFWGILEQHWNGSLLDSKDVVLKYLQTTTYDGKTPNVAVITRPYKKGVKVGEKAMKIYERALERIAGLEKWFIRISPKKSMETLAFTECFY